MGASSSSLRDEVISLYNKLNETNFINNVKQIYSQSLPKQAYILYAILEENTKLKPSEICYFLDFMVPTYIKDDTGKSSTGGDIVSEEPVYQKFITLKWKTHISIYKNILSSVDQINKELLPLIIPSGGKKKTGRKIKKSSK